jgi:hypothetical protein
LSKISIIFANFQEFSVWDLEICLSPFVYAQTSITWTPPPPFFPSPPPGPWPSFPITFQGMWPFFCILLSLPASSQHVLVVVSLLTSMLCPLDQAVLFSKSFPHILSSISHLFSMFWDMASPAAPPQHFNPPASIKGKSYDQF